MNLGTDWTAYHKAGQLFLETGQAVYTDPAYSEAGGWLPYLGPPYAVPVWGLLSLLGPTLGMYAMYAIGVALTVWGLRRRPGWVLLVVLVGTLPMSVLKGQIAPVLGGLVTLGPLGALGAVLLKPTWAVPLVMVTIARRDWRTFALVGGTFAFTVLVLLITPEWRDTLEAARLANQATPDAWAWQFGSITRPWWVTFALGCCAAFAAGKRLPALAWTASVFLVPWCFAHDLTALLGLGVIFLTPAPDHDDPLQAW